MVTSGIKMTIIMSKEQLKQYSAWLMTQKNLYWYCKECNEYELVTTTGDLKQEYCIGDKEPCINCENGTAHVVTWDTICYEQNIQHFRR
jgi:hypothetical protein